MSAIKSVLVHLDASPRCEVRLQAAIRIARQHGAELKALYSVVPQVLQVPSVPAVNALLFEQLDAADTARSCRRDAHLTAPLPAGKRAPVWKACQPGNSAPFRGCGV